MSKIPMTFTATASIPQFVPINEHQKLIGITKEIEDELTRTREQLEDMQSLINEIQCEALQNAPQEARLSLAIVSEKLEPYVKGEFPYSVQRKLMREAKEYREQLTIAREALESISELHASNGSAQGMKKRAIEALTKLNTPMPMGEEK